MMYFEFLKDHIIVSELENDTFNWNTATNKFILSKKTSLDEINTQEQRLKSVNFCFPNQLKTFWSEIGCGYLCSNYFADNELLIPKLALDIYFSEGDWSSIKTSFNLFEKNELPFLRTKLFDYLMIGLEPGVNLGKIYYYGNEIAPDLISFVKSLLEDPLYYQKQQLII